MCVCVCLEGADRGEGCPEFDTESHVGGHGVTTSVSGGQWRGGHGRRHALHTIHMSARTPDGGVYVILASPHCLLSQPLHGPAVHHAISILFAERATETACDRSAVTLHQLPHPQAHLQMTQLPGIT